MRTNLLFCVVFSLSARLLAQTTQPSLAQRLEAIRGELPAVDRQLQNLRAGQDVSYPLVTYTVLENFTTYALEDLSVAVPFGWGFVLVNGCDAGFEPVRDARDGERAVKLVHKSPQTPNVYGMLENSNGVMLQAGKPYTISVWAKCEEAGLAAFTLNAGWSERLDISPTDGKWKRFSKTFTPAPADVAFGPRVLTQSPTPGVIIDDLCLVEGAEPEAGKNLMPNGSFEESWSQQRVAREIGEMETMLARLRKQVADASAGRIKLPAVPRWDGKARPTISGPSFLDSTGRPVFFVGYGHFKQLREDMEKFPAYGVNIVQHGEFGPSRVFPAEDKTDDAAIDLLIDQLDRASKAGVAVDFLISPHYVPDWLFARHPHLRKQRVDFLPYSIYAPEGKELVKRFVDYVLPKIKDKPALLSICLTNEPINAQEPDEFSIRAWHEWLAKRHGDIATLNACWKTTHTEFDDVPQPNPLAGGPEPRPGPAWCDFVRWNQEYFAEFHKTLAGYVKAVAPEIPVHIKATTWQQYRSENIRSGDDPTLLGAISDINGNDSVNLWGFNERGGDLIERGTTDFAQGWRENALGYALQRSTRNAPVFNSENHFIFDRETRYVDPAHIRAGLWMGAIHGQSATTLWVWEREQSNPRSDFAGSIMERPGCAEALGIVTHDLNRAAREITAVQNAPAQVLILQNNTSAVWEPVRYDDGLIKTFTALSYTGLKIGFVTERQLEQGILPTGKVVIVVPNSAHISKAAAESLAKFDRPIIPVGLADHLTRDEYDRPINAKLKIQRPVSLTTGKTHWRELWGPLWTRIGKHEVTPAVYIAGEDSKVQVEVQWQIGRTDDAFIVNLYNASHDPQKVKLWRKACDVLTGQGLAPEEWFILAPMETRLLRCDFR